MACLHAGTHNTRIPHKPQGICDDGRKKTKCPFACRVFGNRLLFARQALQICVWTGDAQGGKLAAAWSGLLHSTDEVRETGVNHE